MRLIDADELKEDFMKRNRACDKWLKKAKDEEIQIRAKATKDFICEVIMTIDNAQTVAVNCKDCDGYEAGYSAGLKDGRRAGGKWISNGGGIFVNYGRHCSNCNYTVEFSTNFCPNCGADMRKGGAE